MNGGVDMPEDTFDVGMLAEHSRMAEWGPGKVVKVRPPYVWVFFRDAPGQAVRQFPASLLVRSSCQTDTVLDNLPAFVDKDGVQVLPGERYTLREALGVFHAYAPEGFGDGSTSKLQKDRERRRAAHDRYLHTLGGEQAEELLLEGRIAELTTRALDVVALARTLSNADATALREGLQDESAARDYFTALLAYLAAEPTEATFAAYVAAADNVPGGETASGATWPMLTLLPFLAQPDRHMLLQPTLTCAAARRLGFDLPYRTELNWPTYEALCRLGGIYLDAVGKAGARDLIDVHFFMATLVVKTGAVARPPVS